MGLSTHGEGVHLQKEAIVVGGPLILVMPVTGSHIVLERLENEATPLGGALYIMFENHVRS